MFKRLVIYLREMYPPATRLVASMGLFFGVYATAIYVGGYKLERPGYEVIVGVLTVFSFLLYLRIADELKDAETDKINFPQRPLPSGRTTKKDLIVLAGVVVTFMLVSNLVFMPNRMYFVALMLYGGLMTVWFFARSVIQPSLIAALISHNPVQFLLTAYIVSIAASSYHFSVFRPSMILVALVFYLPALIWEISRKIRAPKDENQYVTYSQIFGREGAIAIVFLLCFLQLGMAAFLFRPTSFVASMAGIGMFIIYALTTNYSVHHPDWSNYGRITRRYLYSFQTLLVIMSVAAIL